jgi:predicted MPP superfamily phosphohydrolase
MGNHDARAERRKITRTAFQDARLPLLENQGVMLTVGRERLYLAGLDDGLSGRPRLEETMAHWVPGVPAILLLHEPDLADYYANDRRFALQLSGHSHGGQIRTPNNKALVLPYLGKKYDMGLFNINGMWLYTNRGVGVTDEPFRINCPPEITELTLVSA